MNATAVTYLAHAGGLGWDETLAMVLLPIPIIAYLVITARPKRSGGSDDDGPDDDEFDEFDEDGEFDQSRVG
jgi:hypothetical protein